MIAAARRKKNDQVPASTWAPLANDGQDAIANCSLYLGGILV